MNQNNLFKLPTEVIIYEILSRTSPRTVSRTRTLCKQLNEETQAVSFAKNLHSRTNTVSGYFVQCVLRTGNSYKFVSAFPFSKELSLSFLPLTSYLKIIAAAKQGLLLCIGEYRHRVFEYFVCKPATEQWVRIPKPKTRYFSRNYAMAVMSSNPRNFRYKIARFTEPRNPFRWRNLKSSEQDGILLMCEIFDSSKWAWRELPGPITLGSYEMLVPNFRGSMVTVSGVVYALTTEGRVLALDWAAETWELLSLEPLLHGKSEDRIKRAELLECGGMLGLLVDLDLWVWENYWKLRCSVNLAGSFTSPRSMLCNDYCMASDFQEMIFFRLLDSKSQIVKVRKSVFHTHADCIFKIQSDDEFVDLRRTEKKIEIYQLHLRRS